MPRKAKRLGLVAAATLGAFWFAAGTALAAEPELLYVFAKMGGTLAERDSDQERCREIARAAPVEDLPQHGMLAGGGVAAPDVASAVGVALGFAIINAIENRGARDRAELFCLQNLGYAPIALTDEEAEVYGALAKTRREQWERDFVGSDLAGRFPVTEPAVPPLPPYRAESATQGGLRVEVDSLRASADEVPVDGIALTGTVRRWRTAILRESFATTEGPVRISGKAGTVFHQVDYRPQRSALLRTPGATWCGPVEHVNEGTVGAPDVYCFTTQTDGYDVFRPSGYDWLAGPYRAGLVLPRFRQPILLEERTDEASRRSICS